MEKIVSWPFEEAQKIVQRLEAHPKDEVIFAMGYGASGLPHIGTFGEAVRTAMVQTAFSSMSTVPSRLICFSDDMDGLRKVPDNIPHPEKLKPFLNYPLTQVPDPFEECTSFGEHNNKRFRAFLDSFGFQYTFISSTDFYKSGALDEGLLRVLACHEEILATMIPTLREERRKTYSPFLPISPTSGRVLQVPVEEYRVKDGTIVFRDEDGTLVNLPVTGGHCKLQWKIDWATRWMVLGVDYEMAGKDLIDSVTLSSKLCRILGGIPPEGMITEHFLDEKGQKISKSKGNGISLETWLAYAPVESLSHYMFQSPKRAKRLYFDVIPKNVEEYFATMEKYDTESPEQQKTKSAWFIHQGQPPASSMPISFQTLLNVAAVCQADTSDMLWKVITRSTPHLSPSTHPHVHACVGHAVKYYNDIIAPTILKRAPTSLERNALLALKDALTQYTDDPTDAVKIQNIVYDIEKSHPFSSLKAWFSCLYEVLLGQPTGPRMGSFIALYGIENTIKLLEESLVDKT